MDEAHLKQFEARLLAANARADREKRRADAAEAEVLRLKAKAAQAERTAAYWRGCAMDDDERLAHTKQHYRRG